MQHMQCCVDYWLNILLFIFVHFSTEEEMQFSFMTKIEFHFFWLVSCWCSKTGSLSLAKVQSVNDNDLLRSTTGVRLS